MYSRPPGPARRLVLPLACALAAFGACRGSRGGATSGEAMVTRRAVADVFLLTGELRAVTAVSLAAPRGEGELQIRWMADEGADVKAGTRVMEFDATRLIQSVEERRLKLRQAENEREAKQRTLVAEAERKRVAVEKAALEVEKARIDAVVPKELRPAVEWRQVQATFTEKQAAHEKARLEQQAFETSSRADLEVASRTEEKARRDVEGAESSLRSMALTAPKDGIFLVGNFWRSGPDGPRKLQPGDTVWPGFPVASIPDPTQMEVSATLPEVDHGRIATGMKARCILDTYPGRVFEGRVEDVGVVAAEAASRFALAATATGFAVRISLAKSDPLMRPGLSVRVEVIRKSWPQALSVPRQALRFEDQKPIVKRVSLTGSSPVAVAGCTPIECVVESGLLEGDRVLLQ